MNKFQPDYCIGRWVKEVVREIVNWKADIVALHLQKFAGVRGDFKNLRPDELVRKISDHDDMEIYESWLAFCDEDYENQDEFTGLGSVYFIKNPDETRIWDFRSKFNF